MDRKSSELKPSDVNIPSPTDHLSLATLSLSRSSPWPPSHSDFRLFPVVTRVLGSILVPDSSLSSDHGGWGDVPGGDQPTPG